MRIVSKFHDYYDGPATMFGQEPIFFRSHDDLPANIATRYHEEDKDFYYSKSILVFCGITYVMHYKKSKAWNLYGNRTEFVNCTTPDHTEIGIVDQCLKLYPRLKDCPIWLFSPGWHGWIVECPNLLEMGFQKIKDGYTAAQELDRFLSNLAQPIEIPQPVDDITKIKSHGFDVKKSFRKDKK